MSLTENRSGKRRIVVFTGNLAYSVRKGIVELDRAIPGLTWLIILHSPRRTLRQLLKNQWRNLRRNGWRWIPYQAMDVWQRLRAPRSKNVAPTSPGGEFDLSSMESSPHMRLLRVADIHGPESLAAAQAFKPDLGLALAAPILRRQLFSIPALGTVNLHKGRVPDYRGMPPAFWELWNDEASVGCTIHCVDEALDTGDIVREARVERATYSTVRGLQLQLDEVGVDLTVLAVKEILEGTATSQSQSQARAGRTFRKPTLAQTAMLQKKLRGHPVPLASSARQALKDAHMALSSAIWRAGVRRLLAPRITVLLYHRVSDDTRDNLTVGIEQFDRQMALLRRHCRVLSIDQVLAMQTIAGVDVPSVAVTFDDGYLDNYTNAAPILRRHGVPAAFYVSTGIVDTNRRFPHDIRRGNPLVPVMTWNQLRDMRDWGFSIGSHSVSHIDCAAESEETVRTELLESRDALRSRLGVEEPVFAYPYGGRHNMTPERLQLVKEAGYFGCLAAYGGTNVGTIDRYNVLRRGIHWKFSDQAFLFQCLGLW